MKAFIKRQSRNLSNRFRRTVTPFTSRANKFIASYPFITLFSLLGLLVVLIILSNVLRQPKIVEEDATPKTKTVQVYRIGEAPKITIQAQVEKSGVVTISALAPGVVSEIPVVPGSVVDRGTVLVSTDSNYQGGNVADLQVKIAGRNLQNINQTYVTQKDLIKKQVEMAEKVDENSDEMREISRKSVEETESVISLNDEILDAIDANINELSDNNTGGINDDAILQQKQVKSQYLSANNQLRTALRNTQYSASDDEAPAEISDLQKEITKKQLEIQDKAIDLNRDLTRLQYAIARVQAEAMTPAAPFAGTIQRVFVKVGQAVQPGTPLVLISQVIEEDPIVAVAYVPREIARKASYLEPSILSIGNFTYEAFPSYITQDAVQGTLYAIYYPIPDTYAGFVTDTGYISVQVPVGVFDTGAVIPYLPIDSVYQTQNESYVFVIKNGVTTSKKIILGNVIGRYVEVNQGLDRGDAVILDRNVISGDPVVIQ